MISKHQIADFWPMFGPSNLDDQRSATSLAKTIGPFSRSFIENVMRFCCTIMFNVFSCVFLPAERSKRNVRWADQTVLDFASADDQKQLEVMTFSFI